MRDCDYCPLAEEWRAKRGLEKRIGLNVNGCCGFVKDEDIGGREEGAG
jgi:hypothetical protein